MWSSRKSAVTAGIAVAASAVAVSLALLPDDGPPDRNAGSKGETRSPSVAAAPAVPSPSSTFPLSRAPRGIPSVRTHDAARGPGWRPQPNSSVVIARGSGGLADEGKLLAQELKIAYRGAVAAHSGDVELALTPGGGSSQSYTMTVRDGRVRITGPGQAGVFYGTRTLKQSLRADGLMPEGVVRDQPGRPQRGLNLDIARKYYTPGWIEARLREMADLKLNQLGLHFSDDQGFRIASTSHPEIVSQPHLSQGQVRQIVALATRLHITVVPEIDSPGHLGAVLRVHPDLRLRNVAGRVTPGAIDIGQPASARIVDDLLREYAKLFPGPYWHLGADEYGALFARNPAASYPQLAALARQRYGSAGSIQDLTTAWMNGRAAVVRQLDKQPRAWNDGFFNGGAVKPAKDILVEYWTGREFGKRPPQEYLAEGRRVMNLNDQYLYYVLGQPNNFLYPTGQLIYDEWTPLVLRGTTAVPARYSPQIQGGRFAVWGDFPNAQTQDQVARGIRMPLRAVAQKLWDPKPPALTWNQFEALAGKLDSTG